MHKEFEELRAICLAKVAEFVCNELNLTNEEFHEQYVQNLHETDEDEVAQFEYFAGWTGAASGKKVCSQFFVGITELYMHLLRHFVKNMRSEKADPRFVINDLVWVLSETACQSIDDRSEVYYRVNTQYELPSDDGSSQLIVITLLIDK